MTKFENKPDNTSIIANKTNNLNETKSNYTNNTNVTISENKENKENLTKIENITNTIEHNEQKGNITNLENGNEQNINNKENGENKINDRYKIQNYGKQEKLEEGKENKETNEIKETKEFDDIKICVCTPARNQNRYIREFVQYYERLGVDKIVIYDNNDDSEDAENFKKILEDYIEEEFVQIKNWRGYRKSLLRMMTKCYNTYSKDYDWIIFSEVDEFIHLKNYQNIKDFLVEEKFDNCDKIYLNYLYHTDNDLYHYEDRPVQERFPIVETKPENKSGLKHNYVKSLLRGNLGNITINCKYTATEEVKACNAYGEIPEMENATMVKQDFENYYIDYYFSKSVDEFIDKLNDRDMLMGKKKACKIETFENYCGFNKMNVSKIEYIENKTGLNLTIYKNMLKEKNKEY